jgi:hypothetical protein
MMYKMRKPVTILIAATLLLTLFVQRSVAQVPSDKPRYILSPAQAKQIIAERAHQVMLALKRRDMRRLSTFVHPRKGVRFSPYVYVDTKTTRVLSRRQLVKLYNGRQRLVWGEADGSGDPIRMTFRRYLSSFVYRLDLLTDKSPSYNPERPQGPGNTINNLGEVFPGTIIVGYSHEGITGPQGGAMDWQNLFLVFEKMGSQWYLVGIVNDEWTI